jgi:hypothetical protein
MKNKTLVWVLTVIFAIGTFIDVIDGYLPRMISSLCLTLALLCFAIAAGKAASKLNIVGYTLLFVALAAFAFRLINYYRVG